MGSVQPLIITWEGKTTLFLFFLAIVCHLLSYTCVPLYSVCILAVFTQVVHQLSTDEYCMAAQQDKYLPTSNLI